MQGGTASPATGECEGAENDLGVGEFEPKGVAVGMAVGNSDGKVLGMAVGMAIGNFVGEAL